MRESASLDLEGQAFSSPWPDGQDGFQHTPVPSPMATPNLVLPGSGLGFVDAPTVAEAAATPAPPSTGKGHKRERAQTGESRDVETTGTSTPTES